MTSPTKDSPNDGYQPWVKRADYPATLRSILRYLQLYEREWERKPVWIQMWEMTGCAPPQEDCAVMTQGRVRVALGALVRAGLLQRRNSPNGNYYALTAAGRKQEVVTSPTR